MTFERENDDVTGNCLVCGHKACSLACCSRQLFVWKLPHAAIHILFLMRPQPSAPVLPHALTLMVVDVGTSIIVFLIAANVLIVAITVSVIRIVTIRF